MTPRRRAAGLASAVLLVLSIDPPAAWAEDLPPALADAEAVELASGDVSAPPVPVPGDPPLRLPEPEAAAAARPALLPLPRPDGAMPVPGAPETSLRPIARDPWAAPDLLWDGHPEDMEWTLAAMAALRGPGAPLARTVPRDIGDWCPGYAEADTGQRRAFWAGLISALAWHESTHDHTAVGGGGQWFGLVQIAPGTAQWRGCRATTGEALLDGPANLSCGLRIMGITVPRDQVISEGMRGVAADWTPFRSAEKREEMRTWLRRQDFCQPPPDRVFRPIARPAAASDPPRP
jgi:hypothetical protein